MARQKQAVQGRKGFTLAELLVVIIIIVLLVGLLMPALNGAYKMAMRSADASLLHMIAMGCETYQQAFNEYPPSGWDPGSAWADWNAWPPPYGAPLQSVFKPTAWDDKRPRLTGSAKVFACLSGFNTIGCWDPANPSTWGPAKWDPSVFASLTPPAENYCGALTYRGILTHANPADNGNSEDKVYGPYYTPNDKGQTTTTVSWGTNSGQQVTFASRFSRQNSGVAGLDGKPAPVLYYRANSSPADLDGNGKIDSSDIFKFEDNYAITDGASAAKGDWSPYTTAALRMTHPLYAPSDGKYGNSAPYMAPDPSDHTKTIQAFGISRPFTKDGSSGIPAPTVPYGTGGFILISPGPDGEYFTSDDVTNFQ